MKRLDFTSLLLTLGFCFINLLSQAQNENYNISAARASEKIKLDGILTEESWINADVVGDFYMNRPQDTSYATSKTEVRLTYDDQFLYVGAICHDSLMHEKFIVQSLKRDFSFPRTDAFEIHFDPFNDGTNGFSFACNPYGAQREGVLEVGGKYGVTTSWDNKWYSKTKINADNWVVEMAIPFKTIRFNANLSSWNINFARNDQKVNEESTWVPVPQNFNIANLAFTGNLHWEETPRKRGSNVSLIPYISAEHSEVLKQEPLKVDDNFSIGGDAKIALSSSMNLDLTVNPDYSQVEVDDQQTNLTRFEIHYPEKRQFFLENSDLFGSLGFTDTRPFYSRRIGIVRDTSGRLVENRIYAGARMSGKIGSDWRVGVMTLQTEADKDSAINVLSNNYSVTALQRKVFKRSNITGFLVNKQAFGTDSTEEFKINKQEFNRVLGGEFNLLSADAKWDGKVYFHQGITPENTTDEASYGANLVYSTKNWTATWHQQSVGKNYNPEVGFTNRTNYHQFYPQIGYNHFPKNKSINYHGPRAKSKQYFNTEWEKIEHQNTASYYLRWMNTSNIELSGINDYVILRRNFDPARVGDTLLQAGTDYHYNRIKLAYKSNERKDWFINGSTYWGTYYNGHRYNLDVELRYRVTPWGVFSIRSTYDDVRLPEPYSSADYLIFGPKIEILFSTQVFWTTYIQYSEQHNNININSKIQWRFKPASDMFLVFTDNYLPNSYERNNWGIVFKLTYWLNL